MSRVPSKQRKAVVKHELSLFGRNFDVNNYYNDNKTLSVELVTVLDSDDEGMLSIATVGLSEVALQHSDAAEFMTRVELCAGVPVSEGHWCNFLASASFLIQRSRVCVMPGTVLDNVIAEYFPDAKLPHIYLTVPFLWKDGNFPELTFGDVRINWLQCIAISDSERDFISRHGSDAFEDLLVDQEANVMNPSRTPVSFQS
ncbi:suppressor of fused domain protein [Pseudomonas sp. GD03842]|uniref:suppressor of fused domain protein n=1 Tax=Pseudomonas sp. GD03842 TaxID=2975385 RepID=UPI00244C634F|nr:suppressor of fused domain protein [Pseudomonas sp. GD03842]MDH0744735.1 suppressor of fused domain protein [Pseudomonas sp. GD03842]